MAQTALSRQLEKLKAPQTDQVREARGRDSFLYEYREAHGINCDTHYTNAVGGLVSLEAKNPALRVWRKTLFSESSKTFNRAVQDPETNSKVDRMIENFLLEAITPFFTFTASHRCLEWLIYRYQIHEFNVDTFILSILPYHETKLFSRALQLCHRIDKPHNKWHWLRAVTRSGLEVPKSMLINQAVSDNGLLQQVVDYSLLAIQLGNDNYASFCVSILIGCLKQSITSNMVEITLKFITQALSLSTKSSVLSSYCVFAYVVIRSREMGQDIPLKVCSKVLKKASKIMRKSENLVDVKTQFYDFLAVVCDYLHLDVVDLAVLKAIDVDEIDFNNKEPLLKVYCTTVIRNLNDQNFNLLDQLLSSGNCPPAVVKKCVKEVVDCYRNVQSKGTQVLLGRVLSKLERRFPAPVDSALQEVDLTNLSDLYHLVITTGSEYKTLNAGLHDANPGVRTSTLKQLKKLNKKMKTEDVHLPPLLSGILSCFQDTNLHILLALIDCRKVIEACLEPKQVALGLTDVIRHSSAVTENSVDEEETELAFLVKHSALNYLCKFEKEENVLSFLLNNMLVCEENEIKTLDFMLHSNELPKPLKDLFKGSRITASTHLNDCLEILAKEFAGNYHKLTDVSFEIMFMSPASTVKQIVFSILCVKYITTLTDFAMVNNYLRSLVNVLNFKLPTMKLKYARDFESTCRAVKRNQFPLNLLEDLIYSLELQMPVELDHRSTWYWNSQSPRKNYLLGLYDLLTQYAFSPPTNMEKYVKRFRNLLTRFSKLIYRDLSVPFFASFWLKSSSTARLLSLKCCLLQPLAKADFAYEDILALFVAMRSAEEKVQTFATFVLSKFMDIKSRQIEEFFLNKELTGGWIANFFTQFPLDKTKKESSKLNWKELIQKYLESDTSSLEVKYGMFRLTADEDCSMYVDRIFPPSQLESNPAMKHEIVLEYVSKLVRLASKNKELDPQILIGAIFKLTDSESLAKFGCGLMTQKWFDSLPEQSKVVLLIHMIRKCEFPSYLKRVRKFLVDGRLFSHVINALTQETPSPTEKSSRKIRRGVPKLSYDPANPSWKTVIMLLELVLTVSSFTNSSEFLKCCFDLLREIGKDSNQSLEYYRKLLINNISLSLDQPDINLDNFDFLLILDVMKYLKKKENHKEALRLVVRVADRFKHEIIQNILVIIGHLGLNMLQPDNEYTNSLITDTLKAVMPKVMEEDSSFRDSVIQAFLDGLVDLPAHRRLSVIHEITSFSTTETLWFTIEQLIERSCDDKFSKSDPTFKYQDFAVDLLLRFDLSVQLSTMEILLEIASSIDDADGTYGHRKFGSPERSEKRALVHAIIRFVYRIFFHQQFVELLAFYDESLLKQKFSKIVELITRRIELSAVKSQLKANSVFYKNLLKGLHRLLGKVNCVTAQ